MGSCKKREERIRGEALGEMRGEREEGGERGKREERGEVRG